MKWSQRVVAEKSFIKYSIWKKEIHFDNQIIESWHTFNFSYIICSFVNINIKKSATVNFIQINLLQRKKGFGPDIISLLNFSQFWLLVVCLSVQFSSVAQSCLILCDLVDTGLFATPWMHDRLPSPSPTPGACSNSFPSSRWCHPTISSSVVIFSYLKSFPASESLPMSQFFATGGQSIGDSASASFLSVFRTDLLQDWLVGSPFSPRVFSSTTVQKHQFFGAQLSSQANSHMWSHSLGKQTFVAWPVVLHDPWKNHSLD